MMSIKATWHPGWILEQWKTGRIQIESDFSLIMMYWWCFFLPINAFWWDETKAKGSWGRTGRELLYYRCVWWASWRMHIYAGMNTSAESHRAKEYVPSPALLCVEHRTGTRPAASKPHWSSCPRSLGNWSRRYICGHAGPFHVGCWLWTQALVMQHEVLLLSHLPGSIIL